MVNSLANFSCIYLALLDAGPPKLSIKYVVMLDRKHPNAPKRY